MMTTATAQRKRQDRIDLLRTKTIARLGTQLDQLRAESTGLLMWTLLELDDVADDRQRGVSTANTLRYLRERLRLHQARIHLGSEMLRDLAYLPG